MNYDIYQNIFRKKALTSGYSEEDIISCLKYAKPLIQNRLPVIYNTANLAALVGYRTTYLKRAAKYTTFFYRKFSINKRNGKPREIVEPLPSLKEIQSWILDKILSEIEVSKYAKAYVPDRTLIDNVKYHKAREAVLTLDIIDFFGSISRRNVEAIFLNLGYSSNISNLLAKLCTYNDYLPQGACTSPYLSNVYLKDIDEKIAKFCNEKNVRFTRYADDLTFSGKKNDLQEVTNFIRESLFPLGLLVNDEKTKIMFKHHRQIVTGVIVNEKLQTSKEFRNFIRNEVHYLKTFGLIEHLKKTKNSKSNYISHLLGKINFILHVNPKDQKAKAYKQIVLSFLQK